MSVLEIVRWPDPRLNVVCSPLEEGAGEIATLAADMLETMYAAPGRGLAAPQVGVLRRVFVMDAMWKDGTPTPEVFINPVVVSQGADIAVRREGCLSLPGLTVDVARPATVMLRWTTLAGAERQQTFEGFAAACVQHEMDHLDGVLTVDHLTPEGRARALEGYVADPA